MKLKTAGLLFGLFLLVTITASAQTAKEKTQIVEQALTIPELQPYLKNKADLKQLYVLDNGKILKTLPITFNGNPVKFAKRGEIGENFVAFQEAEFKPATAHLLYRLPNQKVVVDVNLVKKGDRWFKKSATVTPMN